MLSKPLAFPMRPTKAFELWQKFVGKVGSARKFFAPTAVSRFFTNNLVHVGTHKFSFWNLSDRALRESGGPVFFILSSLSRTAVGRTALMEL